MFSISSDIQRKWQRIVDVSSEILDVPACLIMKTDAPDHAVYKTSSGSSNPYEVGQSFTLHPKLYCEAVIRKRSELVVPDAMADENWCDNEDLECGMTFYVGYPVCWPDGTIFGTICVLDTRNNRHALQFKHVLIEFQKVIEDDLAMLREIEQRTSAQKELHNVQEQLKSRVSELAAATRQRDEFLAVLAHELRNPLAPLRTVSQLLLESREGDSEVENAASLVERQVSQLTRIVDDVLDVSSILKGKMELSFETVELKAVTELALEPCLRRFKRFAQTFSVTLPEEPVFIRADKSRLAQAIGNILHNASRYTHEGGHIELRTDVKNDQVIIRVVDNGTHIDVDERQRNFDMFAQTDSVEPRESSAAGLGVTYIQRLATLHGGSAAVYCQDVNAGSEFSISIPIASQGSPIAANANKEVPAHKILVVDDNVDAARVLDKLLRYNGFQTHVAYDGEEALDVAQKTRPQTILLDIGMPVLDGLDVCRQIRKESWGHDVTIIALTGWGQDSDMKRTKEAGFDAHLVKPAEFRNLISTLTEVTNSKYDTQISPKELHRSNIRSG